MTDEKAAQKAPLEGVLYTDGSCNAINPNEPASRGHSGWGMHGYLFTREVPKVGAGAKKGVPSATGYDLKATGKGTITVTEYVDAFASVPGEGTNNIAELTAAYEALKIASQKDLSRLMVRSDSKYVVDGFHNIDKWRASSFRKATGEEYANANLWRKFDAELQKLRDKDIKVEFMWVKAHNGKDADPGNALADRYARRGTLSNREGKPIHEIKISEAKGYWKAAHERNRMLNLANWYLTTSGELQEASRCGRSIYYMGDIRTNEEFLGKRISDASFAVVYLKTGEPILGQVREYFKEVSKGTIQGLIVADLSAIFSQHVHDSLMEYGSRLVVMNRQRQSIEHMDKAKDEDKEGIELGHEIRPTRLAYDAVQVLENLENLMWDYLHPKEGSRIRTTDITSLLYERTETPKKVSVKLKSSIPVGLKSMDADVVFSSAGEDKAKPVRLTLGQDLPDRNTLGALAEDGIKVTVVTWPESPQAFRFATIVESGEDVGIWAGPYSNLQLVM